jgi:hypothetical protein
MICKQTLRVFQPINKTNIYGTGAYSVQTLPSHKKHWAVGEKLTNPSQKETACALV